MSFGFPIKLDQCGEIDTCYDITHQCREQDRCIDTTQNNYISIPLKKDAPTFSVLILNKTKNQVKVLYSLVSIFGAAFNCGFSLPKI